MPMEKVEKEKKPIQVFQLNDEAGEYEELELDPGIKLYELLDPSFSLLFLDANTYKAWSWQGSEISVRMKFLAAKLAPSIRDRGAVAMKIVTIDDGDEPMAFKIMVGMQEEVDPQPVAPSQRVGVVHAVGHAVAALAGAQRDPPG